MASAAATAPATTDVLRIADGLELDIEYVTKTAAILAQRRKGKTYTGAVLAEEFVAAGIPFAALDPTGAWWGLRSSADGDAPGLPVVVIGGQHGDLPLERSSGRVIADLVLDHPGYYVLDLSLLGSRAAEREFATAFGDRLHRGKMQPGMDFPLHLFIDEADLFVPQEREGQGDNVLLGVYAGIVRRGGLHGLGTTLISQRPALVNKHALTQIDVLIALRLVAGQDQEALKKQFVQRAGAKTEQDALMDSLSSLPVGEAWVWEPGADPPLFERVRIRQRRTFNSSATPKPGEKRIEPRVLADVELDALRGKMADAIQRARDEDPTELRKRVGVLERRVAEKDEVIGEYEAWANGLDLCDGPSAVEAVLAAYMLAKQRVGFSCDVVDEVRELEQRPAEVKVVERPVFPAEIRDVLVADLERFERETVATVAQRREWIEGYAEEHPPPAVPEPAPAPAPAPPPARPAPAPRPVPAPRPDPPASAPEGAEELGKGERTILGVLAEYPDGRTFTELVFLAGYSKKSSTPGSILTNLRRLGLVEPGQPIRPTAAGLAAAGGARARPTGQALLDEWLRHPRMGDGERKMLLALLELDHEPSHDELCALTGYSPTSSTPGSVLTKLRKLGLVEKSGRRIAREFLEAIGRG